MDKLNEIVDEFATIYEVNTRRKHLRAFEFSDADEATEFIDRMEEENIKVNDMSMRVVVEVA